MASYLYRSGALIIGLFAVPCFAGDAPLWPGARFTQADRDRAIERGLAFIYRTALDRANFSSYGSDYLWCFYEIASTSADAKLREQAMKMGRERAREWRKANRHVKQDASVDEVADVLFGAYAAERLGFGDERLKQGLRRAASHFSAKEVLGFDPAVGPPLDEKAIDLLCDALITTYTADQYGVTLGAPYRDVAKWLGRVRPYRRGEDPIPVINLVTHVVYTVNDYQAHPISPAELPDEFEFLKSHALDRDVLEDGELLGEFVDTLRSFGMTLNDEPIRRGFEELLSKQNPDGSWGDPSGKSVYGRYHPTWTAIDALREYRWAR